MKQHWIFTLVFVVAASVQSASAQPNTEFPRDLHGLWWQPTHPGWAVAVFEQETAMSSVVLTYDFEGKATWLIAPRLDCFRVMSPWLNDICDGPLYRVTGSWFGASSFRQSDVTVRQVGEWYGSFLFPLFGGIGPNVERMAFVTYSVDGLTFQGAGNQPMAVQVVDPSAPFLWRDGRYSGNWWTPHESGWGVGFHVQNNYLQATLFVHGPDGQPRWYVVLASASPFDEGQGPTFVGDVYETRGQPNNRASGDPFQVRRVGSASIQFGETVEDTARLNYSIDNIHVSKAIVKTP